MLGCMQRRRRPAGGCSPLSGRYASGMHPVPGAVPALAQINPEAAAHGLSLLVSCPAQHMQRPGRCCSWLLAASRLLCGSAPMPSDSARLQREAEAEATPSTVKSWLLHASLGGANARRN